MKPPALTPEQLALADAYRLVFSGANGVAVLEDMRARGFHGRTTLARPTIGAPVDPIESARNEGMRAFHLETEHKIWLGAHADRRKPQRRAKSVTAESRDEEP